MHGAAYDPSPKQALSQRIERMFGFSLPKLLLLAAIVAAVWYGYRWMNRAANARSLTKGDDNKKPTGRPSIDDMVECSLCGLYYPRGTTPKCDRGADCPARK
jgi:hypothetical protein